LIEFTIIITLKRRAMNRKIRPLEDQKRLIRQTRNQNHEAKKFGVLNAKVKQLKIEKEFTDGDEEEWNKMVVELPLLKKIDYHSFIGYFLGYCLFNFFYWIDMLLN